MKTEHSAIPDWPEIERRLQEDLTEKRYRHTLGVTYTACALAMRYGADLTQARLSGLLHDCAKCIPDAEKLRLCREKGVPLTRFEEHHPPLLHAKLGPAVAAERYGITDPAVLSAINWHTTGRPQMTLLEKIVYVADYIEPNRKKAPRLAEIRQEAFTDLDHCVTMILQDTVAYLNSSPRDADPMTEETFRYYQALSAKPDRTDIQA